MALYNYYANGPLGIFVLGGDIVIRYNIRTEPKPYTGSLLNIPFNRK